MNTSAKFQSCSNNHTGVIFPRVSATSSKKHKLRNDAWKARMASEHNKDNANVLMHLYIGMVWRVGPLRGVGPPTFSTVLPALSYHISLRIGLS